MCHRHGHVQDKTSEVTRKRRRLYAATSMPQKVAERASLVLTSTRWESTAHGDRVIVADCVAVALSLIVSHGSRGTACFNSMATDV